MVIRVVKMEKAALRSELLAERARMAPYEVWLSSRAIFRKLVSEPVFRQAGNICCYISYDNEVHTHGFILNCLKAGKTVVVPKTDKKQGILLAKFTDFGSLERGHFGILEPKDGIWIPYDPDELDIAVIPAVAFDRSGNRLGFGAGYYDKFLAPRNKKLFLVGVAHDFQLLERLPVCEHDIAMHQVITGGENIYRVAG
jgi:5-formyltetrahydrofolate cyclo-ligase